MQEYAVYTKNGLVFWASPLSFLRVRLSGDDDPFSIDVVIAWRQANEPGGYFHGFWFWLLLHFVNVGPVVPFLGLGRTARLFCYFEIYPHGAHRRSGFAGHPLASADKIFAGQIGG